MSLTNNEKYTPPERDKLYDLLSNHRRRYVIHHCKQTDGPVTLSALAEQVAAWEQDKEIAELTSAERKRVYTSLQQTHLKRLKETGMIEFDGDQITLTDEVKQLQLYLDVVPGDSIPWGVYYLGLSVLGAIVFAGVYSGFVPTGTISEWGWAAIVLFVFFASSVAQVIQNRRYRLDRFEKPP